MNDADMAAFVHWTRTVLPRSLNFADTTVFVPDEPSTEPPPAAGRPVTSAPKRGRYAGWTIAMMQSEYLQVVGRPTGSDNFGYLKWKIGEAEKGRVPVGPRKTT